MEPPIAAPLRRLTTVAITALLAVVAITAGLVVLSRPSPEAIENLSIAVPLLEPSALLYLAEERVRRIMDSEKSSVVVWPAQASRPVYSLFACNQGWRRKRPPVELRLLRALYEAEQSLLEAPEAAQHVVERRLNYPTSYLKEVWPRRRFSLFLDQPLVMAMKDERRWLMARGRSAPTTMPDYASFLAASASRSVKPHSVSVLSEQASGAGQTGQSAP